MAAPGNSPALGAPSQSCRSLVSPSTETVAIPGAPRPHTAHSGSPTTALLNLCEELMFWGPHLQRWETGEPWLSLRGGDGRETL